MIKKIVVASDSFKGTMDSIQVCSIVEEGIRNILQDVEIVKIPIADGGEGTVDAFLSAFGGEKINVTVQGPLFQDVVASYGILKDGRTAVIEMAEASGLILAGEDKNPCLTTTFGTGQLIRNALDNCCETIIIGIGGSATNDGGIGMAAALGVRFLDCNAGEVPLTGGGLGNICSIDVSDMDCRIKGCKFIVACDVDNPLYGPNGAAYVYSPQKGADAEMVQLLDRNLKHYADVVQRDLGIDMQAVPGSGAAGGLGGGLYAFLGGVMMSGINIILDRINFDGIINNTDLIITGEGRIDGQSLRGKVPVGIANRARKAGIPVIALVGDIGNGTDAIHETGITAIFSINRTAMDYPKIKAYSPEYLLKTVEELIRFANCFNR